MLYGSPGIAPRQQKGSRGPDRQEHGETPDSTYGQLNGHAPASDDTGQHAISALTRKRSQIVTASTSAGRNPLAGPDRVLTLAHNQLNEGYGEADYRACCRDGSEDRLEVPNAKSVVRYVRKVGGPVRHEDAVLSLDEP